VKDMNGDDMEDIIKTFHEIDYQNHAPHLLISHTTKGKGVSYMENKASWHHGVPTKEQYEEAIKEINQRIATLKTK
jgi:transketolase